MVKLGFELLSDIGNAVSEKLDGIKPKESTIRFVVDSYSFKKIDEDIFYRFKQDDKTEFVPSDEEIILTFPNVNICIEKEKM